MKQEYKNIKEHDKVHELDAVPMIEKHLHRKIGEEESHISTLDCNVKLCFQWW